MAKTVVITGSSRGFGYAMLELFAKAGCNVVVCATNEKKITEAEDRMKSLNPAGIVLSCRCDVTDRQDLNRMTEKIVRKTGSIDIWINNAGVNQTDKWVWDMPSEDVSKLIDINLKGDIFATQAVMQVMKKQNRGAIYFVEGFGYDGNARPRLSIYGTSKRGVDFFVDGLREDIREAGLNVQVGSIIPGIMITDFLYRAVGEDGRLEIPAKTKKVYNILGDYPETIAQYMVPKILANTKPYAKFAWLTNARAAARFMTAGFRKRDFFSE